ncbi:MAG: DUF4226 domain-containing protein [Mycobacteriaceae bacterium]|nr:DUF4226 domain-containing protein [Mycobacteriaceae bacterium]
MSSWADSAISELFGGVAAVLGTPAPADPPPLPTPPPAPPVDAVAGAAGDVPVAGLPPAKDWQGLLLPGIGSPVPGVKIDTPDPRNGLTPQERAVLTYTGVNPDTASLTDINKALTGMGHNPLPGTPAPGQPPTPPTPPVGQTIPAAVPNAGGLEGAAADAAKRLDDALEKNRSAINTADEQLADAILKATTFSAEGKARLQALQQSIIDEVKKLGPTLDTPTGQQQLADFLQGKTSEILNVLKTAGLDSSSQGAVLDGLAARYAALDSHKPGSEPGAEEHSGTPTGVGASLGNTTGAPGATPLTDDSVLGGLAPDPLMAGLGSLAGPTLGALGGMPAAFGQMMPFGGGLGGGLPLGDLGAAIRYGGAHGDPTDKPDDLKDPAQTRSPAAKSDGSEKPDQLTDPTTSSPDTKLSTEQQPTASAGSTAAPAQAPPAAAAQDATVKLPDGSTVRVDNSAVAQAGRAVLQGVNINDAFQQAGIPLSPPGTPVTAPVSPSRLAFGDIGQYTDHRVMALGGSKVWLNGQVTALEQLETGPNFLGWEHPATAPAASVVATQPMGTR